jgi:hypothetical protein
MHTSPATTATPLSSLVETGRAPQEPVVSSSWESAFWLAQLVFWGGVGLLQWFLLIPALRPDASPQDRWLVLATRVLTGAVVSTGLRWIYLWLTRQPWSLRRILAGGVAALFVAALLECLLFFGVLDSVVSVRGWSSRQETIPFPLVVFHRIDVLTVWSLLFFGFFQVERVKSAELRVAEAETALRTSELSHLEAQLQPHFLFNALTAILACRHDPAAVALVTNGLSEHLRYCLSRQGLIEPLGREIDALTHYLCVQQARFGPRLRCQIECSAEARQVPVPPMLVSPLLENALKYGPLSSPEPLEIEIDCRVSDGTLRVTVTNTGAWVEPGSQGRVGTGLANLRGRLRLNHLERASLVCGPLEDRVQARVTIPLHPQPTQREVGSAE